MTYAQQKAIEKQNKKVSETYKVWQATPRNDVKHDKALKAWQDAVKRLEAMHEKYFD